MDAALELIISVYNAPDQAEAVLKDLRHRAGDKTFKIKEAAVITRDMNGHAHIKDTGDVKAAHGAVFGAITGALIGLAGGPAGAVVGAVAGAATGGATAAVVDMGFSKEQLKELKASMPAGSSALVALVEHTWVEKLVHEMEKQHGTIFRHTVDQALVDEYERQAARH
jgi:uncharacterized membrane protein